MFFNKKTFWKPALLGLGFLLSACSFYSPFPLSDKPDLAIKLNPDLIQGIAYPVNLDDGLDITETSMIAVMRNPDLKAQRAQKNIAQAEAFSAGLLPDPQLNASVDHPTGGPDVLNGFTGGLAFDFRSLLTHSAASDAAQAKARGTDMDVLWQEWQVIQKARTLYTEKYFSTQKAAILKEALETLKAQSNRTNHALARGDVTIEQSSADLAVLMDAQSQMRDLERTKIQSDNDLDALLGLQPGVEIQQQELPELKLPDDATLQAALDVMPHRRPDLIALQAAYDSQEETLYKAVLEQFPSLSVGFTQARDTAGTRTVGLGVTIDLPLFNANRGEIAVQKAAREQLHLDYQARLDQAQSDVMTLWKQSRLLESQLADLKSEIPQLGEMQKKAEKAYKRGDYTGPSYMSFRSSVFAKKMEYLNLQQSLWSNRIALDTLLAWPNQDNIKDQGNKSDEQK